MTECLMTCAIDALPVSVNRLWRNGGRRRTYKSKEAREWQEYAIGLMRAARRYPPYGGRVKMVLRVTRRDRRVFDLDNRIKCVQDCLAPAGVIKDDSQIAELHCFKVSGGASDLCEVEVWALGEPGGDDTN